MARLHYQGEQHFFSKTRSKVREGVVFHLGISVGCLYLILLCCFFFFLNIIVNNGCLQSLWEDKHGICVFSFPKMIWEALNSPLFEATGR